MDDLINDVGHPADYWEEIDFCIADCENEEDFLRLLGHINHTLEREIKRDAEGSSDAWYYIQGLKNDRRKVQAALERWQNRRRNS